MTTRFSVLLFAAGRGTRMGALGDSLPKCLINVAGRPLLDHALSLTRTDAVGQKVINLHYKAQLIRDHLSDQDILFSHEHDRALETGGGLRHALPLLGEGPVVTLNTDAVWSDDTAITTLAAAWQPHMDGLMALVPKARAMGHLGDGDFDIGEDGKLSRGNSYIYTGVQIVRTELLANMTEEVFSLNTLWDRFLASGSLYGVVYSGTWCDVGQPQSIQLAEKMIGYEDV